MPKRRFDPDAPFQSITHTAELTGLAQYFIRQGCKDGSIPCILVGGEFRVNLPLFLRQLNGESLERLREVRT